MNTGSIGNSKMPDHQPPRTPPSFNGPDGEYFDTVDTYTPSKPVPGFYEGNNSGRSVDPGVSWGGGGGYDSGGSAMFLG